MSDLEVWQERGKQVINLGAGEIGNMRLVVGAAVAAVSLCFDEYGRFHSLEYGNQVAAAKSH